jgi:hypothetical protein
VGRADAEKLINCEMVSEKVVLPRLPPGLYWRAQWRFCLWVIEAQSWDAGYSGPGLPLKYVPFDYM